MQASIVGNERFRFQHQPRYNCTHATPPQLPPSIRTSPPDFQLPDELAPLTATTLAQRAAHAGTQAAYHAESAAPEFPPTPMSLSTRAQLHLREVLDAERV